MVGVMFSMIAIESGSVWNSGIVHAIWNVVIIGMGPARENLAHTIDEYAEVEDLTNVFRCYAVHIDTPF